MPTEIFTSPDRARTLSGSIDGGDLDEAKLKCILYNFALDYKVLVSFVNPRNPTSVRFFLFCNNARDITRSALRDTPARIRVYGANLGRKEKYIYTYIHPRADVTGCRDTFFNGRRGASDRDQNYSATLRVSRGTLIFPDAPRRLSRLV